MKLFGKKKATKRTYIVFYGESESTMKVFMKVNVYKNARELCDLLIKYGLKSYVTLLEYKGNVL